jgi:hypothetical protein
MAVRATDNEKAIALAFLRSGHPWLAFGTVLVKSLTRVAIVVALVSAGYAIGRSPEVGQLLNALPSLL